MESEQVTASPSEEQPLDVGDAIRLLVAENAALVAGLRGAQIPQHIGMAAACRTLMVELPRELAAQVEADLTSGLLVQRWKAAHAAAMEASAGVAPDPDAAALAVLLREQGRAAMRHLIARGKAWTAEAYRLEGQAAALEAQVERLRCIAKPCAPVDENDRHAAAGSPATTG